MDAFGRTNAGKDVAAAEFVNHVEKAGRAKLDGFFAYWLDRPGLPDLRLERATLQPPALVGVGNGGGEPGG
jgi:aminopeptidase N